MRAARPAPRPVHVFVIDDEPAILDVLAAVLNDEGYRVTTDGFRAESLDEVLARIVEAGPDALVLDLMIAGVPLGWDLLRRLRELPQSAALPVVVCSALNVDEARADELHRLQATMVRKPFDLDDFLAALDATMAIAEPIPVSAPEAPVSDVAPTPVMQLLEAKVHSEPDVDDEDDGRSIQMLA